MDGIGAAAGRGGGSMGMAGGMPAFNTPLALLLNTLALVWIGLVFVYSASASAGVFVKQVIFVAVGLVGMAAAYRVDIRWVRRWAVWLMLGTLVLLLMVYAFPGRNGSRRWIIVGPVQFQPSELAKLTLVIYMAKMLSDRRQFIKSFFSGLVPASIITGVFALAIGLEPDFGAAMVLCTAIFGMWIAAEMRLLHLAFLGLMMVPVAVVACLAEPYRVRRILAFLSRDPQALPEAWQPLQALVAVGSGGWTGLGLGASRQKFQFLPEAHSDYIFAIIAEETGFLGASLVVLLYATLVLLGWRVAMRTTDLFGSLLASGITLIFYLGAAINMGVVLGMLPPKGLVLPFVSAGGSSMVVSLTAAGLLMNLARRQYAHQAGPGP